MDQWYKCQIKTTTSTGRQIRWLSWRHGGRQRVHAQKPEFTESTCGILLKSFCTSESPTEWKDYSQSGKNFRPWASMVVYLEKFQHIIGWLQRRVAWQRIVHGSHKTERVTREKDKNLSILFTVCRLSTRGQV